MAKAFFVYLPAMMRWTYPGMAAEFSGWEDLLSDMTSSMSNDEIEIMIDEIDRAVKSSNSDSDIRNLVFSMGAMDFPVGSFREHFFEIRRVLENALKN